MKLFGYIFALLFFACMLQANANMYPDLETLKFSKITQKNGLSHNNVECILKDSDGFMWFGTRNGVCRFDGYELKTYYSLENSNSISGNWVTSIAEDQDGNLWFGTANGLNKYDKKTETFTHYGRNHSIPDRINKVKVLSDNSVWACTTYGLFKYVSKSDNFKLFLPDSEDPESINSPVVYDIFETRSKDVYVASEENAIQKLDVETEKFTTIDYKRNLSLNTNFRKQIIEDNEGVLWISANVHGLSSYNPKTGESEAYTKGDNSLSTNVLTGNMALDPDGNIWICTDDDGINIFNPYTKKFKYIRKSENEYGLSSNHIYTIYFDNQNIIWIGTFEEGVNYFDPARYKFASSLYSTNDLLKFKNKSVISIFEDNENRIWVGTDGNGLYMIDTEGNIKEYHYNPNNKNSLSTEVVKSINQDKYGNILIGTYAGGFMSLNLKQNKITRFIQSENIPNQISSTSVWNIFRDSKERIWLGLLGGGVDLYNPDKNTFISYGPYSNNPQKIDFPNIMTISEDSDGDIWFGTEGKGIYILDSQTNKITQIQSDSNQTISTKGIIKCIYQDKWGQIWIGTEGRGLFMYSKNSDKFKRYTIDDGLPNNIIQSIIEDQHGDLWLGTANGLAVFTPNTQKFRTYLEADGLCGNELNQNALIKLHDGRLISGSTNGLDVFLPEQIKTNLNLPRVVLTKLKVLNQDIYPGVNINNRKILKSSITYTDEIALSYKEKAFSIEFAALNYTLPEKCMYAYMLEGFDNDWNYTSSNRRFANYTNLPAGMYTFKVKASNNDGKWGNNEEHLQILILPPFYKTWWFKTIVILLISVLVYLVYRYRLNVHKSRFLKTQFEQEKKIIQLENEKLESELQKLTFHVLNRNRELIDQKNRLMGLSMKAKESVRIGLQDIIAKFDEELSDDKDWKYIEPQLDKVYNNFVARLKELHPDLNISEIKIASYVRMNLSTKEMSEFMHKTTRAIENDRYRLRKKIGLEANDSLKSYLVNL